VRPLKIAAALFIVASAVMLFAGPNNSKVFAILLIIGNLLSLFAEWRSRREP